jgi:predicted phosphoribosyltransferase
VILAPPRGGVPVAAEVAAALKAPLDLVLARKIGLPAAPELAMGAVVESATRISFAGPALMKRNSRRLATGNWQKSSAGANAISAPVRVSM